MRVITDFNKIDRCALALGNFDGVHCAHKKIIEACRDYAKKEKISSGVLLFDIHPQIYLKNDTKLLTTLDEKLKLTEEIGVDFVFVKAFDEETMKMSAEEFFSFLRDKLKTEALFAGYDYTFGYKASGNSEKLLNLCKKSKIYAKIFEKIEISEETVSSTMIRRLILEGKTEEAKKYLGHMYLVCGKVEKGKQNGVKMGIPTANVSFSNEKQMPSDGVYKGFFEVDKKRYKSLINVGKNPTFNAEKRTLEVHIPDFCRDIYEMDAIVYFDRKIRDEIKFNSPEELVTQIKKDLKSLG